MSTFGTLQAQILDDLNRNDMTAQVQLAIKNAVKFYNDDKGYWFQEERKQTTVTSANEYYSLPDDFDEADLLSLTENSDTWVLTPKPTGYIEERTSDGRSSKPVHYDIYDQQIRLYPWPDATFTLSLSYKRNLDAVTATAAYTSNWFTDGYLLVRHRATFDIYMNTLHQPDLAQIAKQQELEAERALDRRNERRRRSGVITKYI